MDDDMLPAYAEELIEATPGRPIDAPRTRRTFPVEDVWEEGGRYLGLRVPVGEEYQKAYRRPGQYVTLSPEQLEPRFLVIANAPESAPGGGWEFLVDRETELGTSIDPLERGASLEISPPEGPGFPVDEAGGMDVLCFVTGSGIASVRPVLEYWRTRETLAPDSVALYYGESDRRDFAYRENLAQWRDEGVRTFLCDGEGEGSSEFQHVQDAFREDDPDLERAVAFVAGAPVMKRPVIRLLIERGIPIDRIVINV